MSFANPLPWWALVAVVAASAATAWFGYRRVPLTIGKRAALASIRFVTLLLLVALLMRPIGSGASNPGANAIVPILVDTSRSMSIEDADRLRRIDRAREMLETDLLPTLGPRFKTEILAFGDDVRPATSTDLGAHGRRSDLVGALHAVRDRYRGQPVAGVVLLSDGGDTGGAVDRGAHETTIPVFPIGIGSRAVNHDREVLSVTAAEAVLDDSRVELAVSAVSHGYATSPIEMRLLENGRFVDVKRAVPAADGSPVREVFHVAPGKGAPTVYTVEIPAAAGELVPENNSRSVLVQPPARLRRVLLVQGAPGFEHSFLRRAWSGDSGLEIDSVVRKGKNEQGDDTFYIQAAPARAASLASGYPENADALFAYDAVVLANMEGALLTRAQLETTRDFVGRRGGGLLVLGAQSFLPRGLTDTPLEEVLPLALGERGRGVVPASSRPSQGANRVSLTTPGAAHPVMQLTAGGDETRKRWEAVPALASIAPLGAPRPGATVLAVTHGPGGAPRALVAVQRYGEGRSMVFTGEAAWRWRMLLPAADRSYDTFWRQAVRWLALPATDPVSIVAPAGAAPGDLLELRVEARTPSFDPLADARVDVRITGPDSRVETLPATAGTGVDTDGSFVARYRADQPGLYRVSASVSRAGAETTSATTVLVGGADPEMTDPRVNLRVLQRLAAASGGHVVEPGGTAALADRLQAAVPAAALRVQRDVWHTSWSFLSLVLILCAEWILRRRWGLR